MIKKYIFVIILLLDTVVLLTQISNISISYAEALVLYENFSFLQLLIKSSIVIFGQNDFALRLPMIIMHLMSVVLLYEISKKYLSSQRDRIWLILLFILLPGVVSSALVVNSAGLVIFGLFLFVYIYEKLSITSVNILLLVYLFADPGFIYLFVGMSVFYIYNKQRYYFFYNVILFLSSAYLYGFEVGGLPTGHFLDLIGIYSTIFTPFIFIYIFYGLYRRYLNNQTDYIWYIASTTLVFSVLLSLRQRVIVEHFAPYLIIALPLVAQTFVSSYKVRLKMFRTKYRVIFLISFIFLAFNYLVVLFNKELYLVLDSPKKHFAYNTHIAHDLAKKLKLKGIYCVSTDKKMSLRLSFYGIKHCDKYKLEEKSLSKEDSDVTISYRNKILYSATVTNVNK
ncbi:MAG: hypothetical protein QM497_04545 [Sulfurimonas sp.]